MKKSIVISLLIAACIIGTALCSFASTGIVTTDTLRLRNDASTNASIIMLLSMDDKVEVLEESNGWYKVIAGEGDDKKEGYVSAEYIKVLEDVKAPEETEAQKEETNNAEEENENNETTGENTEKKETIKSLPTETKIYITPVINSLIVDTLEEEKKIEVVNTINGWSYITAENIKGWVRTDSIVEKEEAKINENSSPKIGYISVGLVNFREEPNASSNIICDISKIYI